MKKKNFDILLFIAIIVISTFGLIMITSASYIWAEYKFNDPFKFTKNQGLFFIIGIIMMIIISKIDYRIYYEKCNMILIGCICLLVLVLIPGIGAVRNGSRSWFGIGSFGVQPSEFTKLALIIFTSKYLQKNEKNGCNYRQSGVLSRYENDLVMLNRSKKRAKVDVFKTSEWRSNEKI